MQTHNLKTPSPCPPQKITLSGRGGKAVFLLVVLVGKVVEFKGFMLPSRAATLLGKRINCLAVLCVVAYL